jgi:hypothetical protein
MDTADKQNKPNIFASEETATTFMLWLKPFDIAKNTAGPGLNI